MTVREIQQHLSEMYGTELSPTLISNVTDAVVEEVKQWQSRLFDSVYPVAGKLRNYMTVTGDVSFHGILDKIPSEHWRHYEVSLSSFVHDAEHVETARDGLPDDGSFVALKVGRTKTESLKVALRTNPVLGVEPNVTR